MEYLVAYDYGSGGVWFWLKANSKSAVRDAYPELEIVDEIPTWMDDDEASGLDRYDLDASPQGFLNSLLEQRREDLRLVGAQRPVFVVGATWQGRQRWAFLRAAGEHAILSRFPELSIRHGRDPDWQRSQKNNGVLDSRVYDIDELCQDIPFFDAINQQA